MSSRTAPRLVDDHPVRAVPSPWWTIIGLKEGDGWYELFQFGDETAAKHAVRVIKQNDSDPVWDRYEDVTVLSPSVEHTIPAHIKGQHRAYLESGSPATLATRRALVRGGPVTGSVRSSRRRSS